MNFAIIHLFLKTQAGLFDFLAWVNLSKLLLKEYIGGVYVYTQLNFTLGFTVSIINLHLPFFPEYLFILPASLARKLMAPKDAHIFIHIAFSYIYMMLQA